MKFLFQEPAGREARPSFAAVPEDIVFQVQKLLKEKIIAAEIVWGGYSPSANFVATLGSRKKVFIKGTHPGQDAHGTQMLQQEIDAYQTLPGIEEISPAYRGRVGDGREDGWMLAVFDYIDTVPTLPWTREKISAVFELLAHLHFCGEKRLPGSLPAADEKNYVARFLRPEGGWLRIRNDKKIAEKFLTAFEDEDAGQRWLASNLPELCKKQNKAHSLGGPVGIIHQDLRADNILFDKSGRAYLVDWPNACRGPVVMDLAGFLPAISAESTYDAETLLDIYEKTAGAKIRREDLAIALASFSGHLADNVYRAVPAKLPRLRWIQKTTLWAMLQWAPVLMDTAPPPRFKGLRRN